MPVADDVAYAFCKQRQLSIIAARALLLIAQHGTRTQPARLEAVPGIERWIREKEGGRA